MQKGKYFEAFPLLICKMVFILPLIYMVVHLVLRILIWNSISFSTLEALLHYYLACLAFMKCGDILLLHLFHVVYLHSPTPETYMILFPQCSDISCLISTSWKWKSLSHVWLFVTPWTIQNSLGQNTGVGSLSLLQSIFPTQGLNPGLLHCRWIRYQLSHKGSPRILEWIAYPFSSGSSRPRNWTRVSCITGGFFTDWAVRDAPSYEFSSVAQSCPTLCDPLDSLSITNSWSLLKCMSIESVMPSNHLILCWPLLLLSVFPSIRVFSKESFLCIRWPKYWSFSLISVSYNEYSGLISFKIDWFDLLAV